MRQKLEEVRMELEIRIEDRVVGGQQLVGEYGAISGFSTLNVRLPVSVSVYFT